MNKKETRERLRSMRWGLTADEQARAAHALAAQIADYAPYRAAHTVMAYMACRGELSLEAVIGDVLASGRRLALPRCEAPGIMTARLVKSMDDLSSGTYGLLEPKADCPIVDPGEINLVFVPGAAFDREGHRIGQGGGYYDRFLKECSAHRAGVCHGFALLDSVPWEAHDETMDDVITPDGIISMGKQYDRRT